MELTGPVVQTAQAGNEGGRRHDGPRGPLGRHDENYYETISDALLEASTHAVEDEAFRKALGAK
jgi:hypothetical protein